MAATLSTPTQTGRLGQPPDRRPFRPRGPDRVGDEDAVESGLGEDLGLTTLPAVIPLVSALT